MLRRTIHFTGIHSVLRSLASWALVVILFAWDTTAVNADGILVSDAIESSAFLSDQSLLPITAHRSQGAVEPTCSVRRDDQPVLWKTRHIPTPGSIDMILGNQNVRTIVVGARSGSRRSTQRSRNFPGDSFFGFSLNSQQPPVVGHVYPAQSTRHSPPAPFELLRPPQTLA